MSSAVAALKAGLSSSIELTDLICPVCLSVFVEPVQFPCTHVLCMPCFKSNLDKTSLTCPICRERIGSWCRKATKQGTLVEQQLWKFVQENYGSRVFSRLAGLEGEDSEEVTPSTLPNHQLADTGEVGAEFSAEVARIQEEETREKALEEERSLELAKRLIEEERAEQEEQEVREHKEKMEKRRSRHRPATPINNEFHPPNIKKRKTLLSDTETSPFTKPVRENQTGYQTSNLSRCPSTESNNSIDSELTHFRPIRVAPISPPKKLADGSVERPTLVLTRPSKNLFKESPSSSSSPSNSLTSLCCFESLCPSTPSTSNVASRQSTPEAVSSCVAHLLDNLVDNKSVVMDRLNQEKYDEELARRLQEELNKESRGPPDRRKGSQDEYQLRQTPNRQSEAEEKDCNTNITPSRDNIKAVSARKRFRDLDDSPGYKIKRKKMTSDRKGDSPQSKPLKQGLISKFVISSSISIV